VSIAIYRFSQITKSTSDKFIVIGAVHLPSKSVHYHFDEHMPSLYCPLFLIRENNRLVIFNIFKSGLTLILSYFKTPYVAFMKEPRNEKLLIFQ